MNTIVSVVKVTKSIEQAVSESMGLIGGIGSEIYPEEKIYLKPNFVAPRESHTGATTNLQVIKAVAEEVKRWGGIPIIYETPAIEFDQNIIYDVLGIRGFAQENGIGLAEGPSRFIKIKVPGGKALKKVEVPQELSGAKIINIPKLKTHVSAKMSCAMKNLMGLLSPQGKRRVHIHGVHQPIRDINRVIKPMFNVVDATMAMEGDGPTYGDRVELGLIIAGRDTLAVDRVCCSLIGLPEAEVGYLSSRSEGGENEEITIVGEELKRVSCKLRIPKKGFKYRVFSQSIYTLDVLFSLFSSQPLNKFLYSTGFVGTNPKLLLERCSSCGQCVEVCPVKGAVDLAGGKIMSGKCIRCLRCYEICPDGAIVVKGFSGPRSVGGDRSSVKEGKE